jgi:hypothetical protein
MGTTGGSIVRRRHERRSHQQTLAIAGGRPARGRVLVAAAVGALAIPAVAATGCGSDPQVETQPALPEVSTLDVTTVNGAIWGSAPPVPFPEYHPSPEFDVTWGLPGPPDPVIVTDWEAAQIAIGSATD